MVNLHFYLLCYCVCIYILYMYWINKAVLGSLRNINSYSIYALCI